jgi:hypothetical protein
MKKIDLIKHSTDEQRKPEVTVFDGENFMTYRRVNGMHLQHVRQLFRLTLQPSCFKQPYFFQERHRETVTRTNQVFTDGRFL